MSDQLEQANNELASINEKIAQGRAKLEEVMASINKSKLESESVTSQEKTARENLGSVLAELGFQENELAQASINLGEFKNKSEEEKERVNIDIGFLVSNKKNIENEIYLLKVERQNLVDAINLENKKYAEHSELQNKVLSSLQQKVLEQENELNSVRLEKERIEEEKKSLQYGVEALITKAELVNVEINEKKTILENLATKIIEYNADLKKVLEQINEAKLTLLSCQKDVDEKQIEMQNLKDSTTKVNEDLNKVMITVANLNAKDLYLKQKEAYLEDTYNKVGLTFMPYGENR